MLRSFSKAAWALALLAVAITMPVVAHAQAGGGTTNQYTLSQATYTQVKRIQKLMGASKYGKALTMAKHLLPDAKDESPYAEALVNQLIAQTYLLQKELDKAAPYLERIVQLDALQPQEQQSSVEELAAIYLMEKKYPSAIHLYKQVISEKEAKAKRLGKKPDISAQTYYRLGLAYSFNKQFPEAMSNIERAIGMAKQPHKSWYENWFIVAYKMQNFSKANDIASKLVADWPNDKDFWTYYANTALLLHKDRQATAIYGLMYKRGMLKDKDSYLQLANLLLESKAPYKAGEIMTEGLEKGIIPKTPDNYDALAGAWMQARDWHKALAALGKEAALSPTGAVYLRQAAIYLNQQDYGQAMRAARNAIKKGGLKSPGRAWMILGQGAFAQKNWQAATNAFHQAENYKEQRKDAQSWIQYVENARKGSSNTGSG